MRALLAVLALSLSLAIVAEAAPKKAKRKPANKLPTKVISLLCREGDGPENVIGIASLSMDGEGTRGAFGMTLYIRTETGYASKALTGTYTMVPNGYVFTTRWKNSLGGEYTPLHVHPNEKTDIPGLAGKQTCGIVGQLESN